MSPEPRFPTAETAPLTEQGEAERELEEGRPEHVKKPEKMSPDEREHLCREEFIQGIMGTESVPIEQRKIAADYVRAHPNEAWRHYGNGLDIDEAWVENGVWHLVFENIVPGPEQGNRVSVDIPLTKE